MNRFPVAQFNLISVACLLALMMLTSPALAQDTVAASDALTQEYESAQFLMNDGLTTMNEATIRRSAEKYELIIDNFRLDSRHFDAYFASAFIHIELLQSYTDYEHAKNLLSLLINNHPSNFREIADAYLTRANLNYRCFRNYQAAQEDLSILLNNPALFAEIAMRELDVKILLAKCRQKLGHYDLAKNIWDEILFSNPEFDTEGRHLWIENSNTWYMVDSGNVRLFFEQTVDRVTYTAFLAEIRDAISTVEATWGLMPGNRIDVFLYDSADHLFDYTLRSEGFALPVDAEIHLSVNDMDNIEHFVGWVSTQRLNSRPEQTQFPFLRAGFNHYFIDTSDEIDMQAARALYFYGGQMDEIDILFPLSFDYTYSDEYGTLASSFLHYLLEEQRVDLTDLQKFYRLLWTRPGTGWHSGWAREILSWGFEGSATVWGRDLLTPEQIYSLASTSLGINLSTELSSWQASLSDEIDEIQSELGSMTAVIEPVRIDLSTPEKTLESWWAAYRTGNFDALIECSTSEMALLLSDARDLYIEQDILDDVILEHFIRPYHTATMVVVEYGDFAPDIRVFQVRIEKGTEIEEITIVVKLEDGKWKVDAN